jgi:hypothetical protein
VEDFIKDVDLNRVSSPFAQTGFATGEALVMSTDLLSMDYEDARVQEVVCEVSAADWRPKRRSAAPGAMA